MILLGLLFLSGFLLSSTAAYYSIIGLIAIFPGAKFAIAAMGITLELAKLVTASWLYRNWKEAPKLLRAYLVAAVGVLMFITSMGIFGFLSKSHLEHSITNGSEVRFQIENIDATIESREKSITLIQRQLDNIDNSLARYIQEGAVTRGLNQKKTLDTERKNLESERKAIETELIDLKTQRNGLSVEVQKQEVEVGPLKYIAELIYGENSSDHFDDAVRAVIILLVIVFDPLAVAILIAANSSIKPKETVAKPPKRAYNKRKKPSEIYTVKEDNYGIQPVDNPPDDHVPNVLRR